MHKKRKMIDKDLWVFEGTDIPPLSGAQLAVWDTIRRLIKKYDLKKKDTETS